MDKFKLLIMRYLMILLCVGLLSCEKEDPVVIVSETGILGTWAVDSTQHESWRADTLLGIGLIQCGGGCHLPSVPKFVFTFSVGSVNSWSRSPDLSTNTEHGSRNYTYDDPNLSIDKIVTGAARWYDMEVRELTDNKLILRDLSYEILVADPSIKMYDLIYLTRQ